MSPESRCVGSCAVTELPRTDRNSAPCTIAQVWKQQLAGWSWIAAAIALLAQLLVAAAWPGQYSWADNTISDLGATTCGVFDAGTRVERTVCSPLHVVANAATVVNGLLLTVGAIAVTLARSRPLGVVGPVLLAVGGLLVVGVGVTPLDKAPAAHEAFALAQAPVQWTGMVVAALAARRTGMGTLAVVTLAATAVSVVGLGLFVSAVGGGAAAAVGVGLVERLAFDTLTIWGVVAGVLLLRRTVAVSA